MSLIKVIEGCVDPFSGNKGYVIHTTDFTSGPVRSIFLSELEFDELYGYLALNWKMEKAEESC